MNDLIKHIKTIQNTSIAQEISSRIHEFKRKGEQSYEIIFSELCYCILTANCSAESCLHTQHQIGPLFHKLEEQQLSQLLRKCHYRFPNIRASYIKEASSYAQTLKEIIQTHRGNNRREWLVNHIKGIGYKEASHFLRNIGYEDYGIIDKHILNLLKIHDLISIPTTMNKKRYLEIEQILKKIATKTDLSLASLDLYLWYMQTGKILK